MEDTQVVTVSALTDDVTEAHGTAAKRLAAAGLGAAALSLIATGTANAADADDVKALSLMAGLEVLAVSVYTAASGLKYVTDGNATVLAFLKTETKGHQAMVDLLNGQITTLKGTKVTAPNAKYKAVVDMSLATLTDYTKLVAFAKTYENVIMATGASINTNVTQAKARDAIGQATIQAGQRLAVLRAVGALLAANAANLIMLETDGGIAAKLPKAAGSVGFSDDKGSRAFVDTTAAEKVA